MRRVVLVVLCVGCSDYKVGRTTAPPDTPADTDDTGVSDTDTWTDTDTDSGSSGCDDADLGTWTWLASAAFSDASDPTDGAGIPFHDPAFDDTSWSTVTLPHRDIPVGTDRAYRGTAALAELPPNLVLDLQSDDGIWLWVNGTEVGHWGGEWQQEGCVNEHAECVVTSDVDPVDVTALLVEDSNVIAARVSNPVMNAWFELIPGCVE